MKKAGALFILLLLLSGSQRAYATHAAGGELLYERIAPDTYRFTFKFYRACGAGNAAEPANVKMCYGNQCGVTNQSITLYKVAGNLPNGKPNGTPVSTGCPAYPTSCNGGTIPGYQEWWYTADLTLPSACNYWKFWVSIDARNNAITNLLNPGSQTIYIEAMFNNAVSEHNSSPYFSNVPVPYCCANQLFSYNNGTIDPDGDSLHFESIRPRTGSSNNNSCTALPADINYTSVAYNEISNPFNTGNTYTLNPFTGALSFTPAAVQTAVVTVKVSEYRNKQLIGYVMRDIQIIITTCNAPSPTLVVDSSTISGGIVTDMGFRVSSCAGNLLYFCFDLKSPSATSILVPSDNHTVSIPGGTVTYTNTLTDSVRGCVTWSTTPQDVGLHVLTVTVRDSACRPPGLILSNTFSLPIAVNPVTVSSSTVTRTICQGDSYLGHTVAGTYTDTLINYMGCDSIHIMDLSVNPVYRDTVADTVCPHELPYHFGPQLVTSGGAFTEVYRSAAGCDSNVTLMLHVLPAPHTVLQAAICPSGSYEGYTAAGVYQDTFAAANGCDSIRTIHLTVNPVTYSVIDKGICPGQSFLGYTATGTYLDTFVNMYNCDSIRTINLTVNPVTFGYIAQTICEGDSYLGYDTAGIYVDTLVNANSCDSIRTLELTVLPRRYETVDTAVCIGESYAGYTATGTYVDTLVSSLHCDSIRTLHLVVKPIKDTVINTEICTGESFLGYTATGSYTDTFISSIGCDSIRRINLTVNLITYSVIDKGICPGQSFQGYTATGTYLDTFVNMYHCDSIRTINLTVHPVTFGYIAQTICEGDSYLGYDTAGIYVDTLVNANSCDSIRTLELTVLPRRYETVDTAVCAGESYAGYTTAGTYVDTLVSSLHCDSIRTLHLVVKPIKDTIISMEICTGESFLGYTATGSYTDTFISSIGCDSIRRLSLTVNPITYSVIDKGICPGQSFLGYTATGTYVDTFVNMYHCDSIRTINLTVHPVTYAVIDTFICPGGVFAGYDTAGTYTDTLVNANGCDSIRTIHLSVHPVLYRTVDTAICDGGSYGGHTVTGTYIDTLVSSLHCDSIRTLHLAVKPVKDTVINMEICSGGSFLGYTASGSYTDVFLSSLGCDSNRHLNLTVHPVYLLDTMVNVCEGTGYFAGGMFRPAPGVYWDSLHAVTGCDSVIKTTVIFSPDLYPDLGPDRWICPGDSLQLTPGDYQDYQWSTGGKQPGIWVSKAGYYTVTVQNVPGCAAADTVYIGSWELPEIQIRYGQERICIGDTIHLLAEGGVSYAWYRGEELAGTERTYAFLTPDVARVQLVLTGTDDHGCKGSQELTLHVVSCCGNLYVPNSFTPNGDGRNDRFRVMTAAFFEQFHMMVTDRWGRVIFETDDQRAGWDGTHHGIHMQMDTYFYLIKAKCYHDEQPVLLKGDITLIR